MIKYLKGLIGLVLFGLPCFLFEGIGTLLTRLGSWFEDLSAAWLAVADKFYR